MTLRKTILLIFNAVLLCAVSGCKAPAATSAPISLHGDGETITAQSNGNILISDAGGKNRVVISGYKLAWAPPETAGGTAALEGEKSIHILYQVKNDPTGKVRIEGDFAPVPHGVHIQFDIWGPDDLNVKGAMMERNALPAKTPETVFKPTRWVRDVNGGVPYEKPLGNYFVYHWPGTNAIFAIPGANQNWRNNYQIHCPPKRVEPGHFVAAADLIFGSGRPGALVAQYLKQPLSLDIWTEKNFNIWDSAAKPLTLQTQTVNTGNNQKPVELSWWARDYDGKIVAQGKGTKVLLPGEAWNRELPFPAPARGILFVEVDARSGSDQIFRRTNLAVLPPHHFVSGSESIFGLSATFPYPSQEAVTHLLQRMSVRWLRHTELTKEQAAATGISQNYGHAFPPDQFQKEPDKKRDWILEQLKSADKAGAVYWETGNEWNMIGGIGKAKNADTYAKDWLPLIDQLRKESDAKVKIMSQGIAGMDVPFVQKIQEDGAWNSFDAFALHPGRGNYTPDYLGDNGDYWNFLGTIRKARALLAQYGEKPLWITEAYACTQPNSHWHDTLRHAAENVVLSYALAMSEGVRVMDWYQLNDGTWFAPNEARPSNSEFYYGLLNADLSPKPSLLAYCTIAEALDGAKFVRELHFKDSNNKGLLYDTSRGSMAILWNRSDGYILNGPKSDKYAAPEPWVDPWKTKVNITIPAKNDSIKVIDNIGREKEIAANNHQAQLTLDGAAQIVYGIDASVIP
jgi:hypothetical protein